VAPETSGVKQYRDGLPPMPERIAKLPVERGYPVPWFVDMVDGHYDFRIMDGRKIIPAVTQHLCWICGERLGASLAFTIGPMCAINRTISEPPSHRECAEWSIKACPFLTQQELKRNTANMPEGVVGAADCGIKRQPGVICLWITKSYTPQEVPAGPGVNAGILFRIGEPDQVLWFREGRPATREEVEESITSGLPTLEKMAKSESSFAVYQLREMTARAQRYLPSSDAPKRFRFGVAAKR
jgi:hypothetical protein